MSEPSEHTDLLNRFGAKGFTKSHRSSTPRIEKGTQKVIPHKVQERASILLYALLRAIGTEEKAKRDGFTERMSDDVGNVVSDFGFDINRVKIEGEKLTTEILDDINRDDALSELEQYHKAFGLKLEAMKRGLREDREGSGDVNSGTENTVDLELRNTRSGQGRKRNRETLEAVENLDKMLDICKRIK